MNEEWRIINDYLEYEVSNLGQVRRNGKVLKPRIDTRGYYVVSLWKQNQGKTKSIHRLVAETFLPNIDNKPCVDHIDRNPTNNTVTNLRWVTYSENNLNTCHRDNPLFGITFDKTRQRYRVQIGLRVTQKFYGRYDTLEEAVQVRNRVLNL